MNKNIRPVASRILKMKYKEGELRFVWECYQDRTKHWDRYSLTCKDLPRPEIAESLHKLTYHVAEICEFAEAYLQQLIVSGVSLSYNDKGNRFLVITAQKSLACSKGPLVINTPVRAELPENEMDSKEFCWSDSLVSDIDGLEHEAWRYINGDRAQQTLDFDDGGSVEKDVAWGTVYDYKRRYVK